MSETSTIVARQCAQLVHLRKQLIQLQLAVAQQGSAAATCLDGWRESARELERQVSITEAVERQAAKETSDQTTAVLKLQKDLNAAQGEAMNWHNATLNAKTEADQLRRRVGELVEEVHRLKREKDDFEREHGVRLEELPGRRLLPLPPSVVIGGEGEWLPNGNAPA